MEGRKFHDFGAENKKIRSPNFSFNCGSSYSLNFRISLTINVIPIV